MVLPIIKTFLRTDEQFYAKTPKELLMIARDMAKRADEQLPRFFKTLPRKPYGVAPVPDAIAPKYTGGRYIPPSNDTNPGFYWVNTYDLPSRTLYTLPSLTVHEAVPGHHLQGSLNNELGWECIPHLMRNSDNLPTKCGVLVDWWSILAFMLKDGHENK